MSDLTRTLRIGSVGTDVEAVGRMLHRYLETGQLANFHARKPERKRRFGLSERTLAKKAARKAGLPAHGVVGPKLFAAMVNAGAKDFAADGLLERYAENRKPKLVEPRQGFDSLHPSLWEAYSLGRRMGFSDLGTYNSASTLPGGGRSDHAVYPAMAFDLGIDPDTGWQHLKARAYFLRVRLLKAVEYVILGDRIWSRGALRAYRSGGHLNHLHVSGCR